MRAKTQASRARICAGPGEPWVVAVGEHCVRGISAGLTVTRSTACAHVSVGGGVGSGTDLAADAVLCMVSDRCKSEEVAAKPFKGGASAPSRPLSSSAPGMTSCVQGRAQGGAAPAQNRQGVQA